MPALNTNLDCHSNFVIGELIQNVNRKLEYSGDMEWFERIVELRRSKPGRNKSGWTRAELARRSGVSYDVLNKYERGDINQPNDEILRKLASALGTSEQHIRYGNGAATIHVSSKDNLVIRGEVAAGLWLEADLFETENYEKSTITRGDSRYPFEHQYLLRVNGESLNKIAHDGDLILCLDYVGSGIEIKSGDIVVVERSRDGGHTIERTAKRVVENDGEIELRPESTDPRFQTPVVFSEHGEESSEVRILAKVLGVVRPFS